MKLSRLLLVLALHLGVLHAAPEVNVTVTADKHERAQLLLALVQPVAKQKNGTPAAPWKPSSEFLSLVDQLKEDVEFSGQFAANIKIVDGNLSKKNLHALSKAHKCSLALFLSEADEGAAVEWRLYDVTRARMLKGKKYTKRGQLVRGWAHNIADAVWPVLTGQDGFFSTMIVYCKDVVTANKQPNLRKVKHICVADYNGKHEKCLVNTQTVNVAPRFNNDQEYPLVFYSECTNENMRLMMANMNKQRAVASTYDGINMQATFSPDGSKMAYCASRGDGCCQLYYAEKGVFKRLTNNAYNNISPTFGPRDEILYFCSDSHEGKPQIYSYSLKHQLVERVTQGATAASPAFCSKNQKLAYAQRVDGVMQLMLFDPKKKEHRQITFDPVHKQEVSWSPCGNYMLFLAEGSGKSQIKMLNLLTNKQQVVVDRAGVYSYPSWSPRFHEFPVIS